VGLLCFLALIKNYRDRVSINVYAGLVQRQLHFHRRQLEFPFHSIKLSASPRVAF